MRHIFFVKSPLQLLNAIEAKHHFHLDEKYCYLLVMGDRKSYLQLMKLVHISKQWVNIIQLNDVDLFAPNPWLSNVDPNNSISYKRSFLRSSIFSIYRLNRLAKAAVNTQNVFIGDNNNKYMRHFVNSIKHENTILLDDGTATLEVARQRVQGDKTRKPDKIYKRIKLATKRMFQGLKDQPTDKVTFFTAYNVEIKSPDEIVVNDFSYLRLKALSLPFFEGVYFLGSPLSEIGLMTEESYLDQLSLVRSQFTGQDFIYVAHRRESNQKLDLIRRNIDINVSLFEYPVEYQFTMVGPRPKTVVSFVTSALDNLKIILDDSVKIISFKLLDGTYTNRERFDAIYRHYLSNSSENFQVKTLN